ncbi:beta-lactamase superfamily II metal-dependent hydrolase [Anaerotaenia torta]|uniref:ComEC/Rec2 family competence protein n=1 Tax=Anaerotaenia torta TaxID=433293 RepID=UPI003D213FB1
MKVAHHGSRNSTPEELLEIIRPGYALISCGRRNRYGHPHKELLERLKEAECRVKSTPEAGAVSVWTDGKRIRVKGFLEE